MKRIISRLFIGLSSKGQPLYKLISLFAWKFIMPCKCSWRDIRDTYHCYIWRNGRCHRGIDFIGYEGSPIYASGAGTIVDIGYNEIYGNYIVIDHGINAGYQILTKYAHLRNFVRRWDKPKQGVLPVIVQSKLGDSILKGEKIAEMGSTGDSDTNHLHFEIHIIGINEKTKQRLPLWASKAIDPIVFLPANEVAARYKMESEQNERLQGDPGL